MMKTIGIIGAMPSELVDIRKGLPNSEIQKKAGFDYYLNQVGDTRVVHVCSGIAKVNAAVCTRLTWWFPARCCPTIWICTS